MSFTKSFYMKKTVFLLIFISANLFSFAQFVNVTPKIGLTISTARGFDELNYRPGYLFGASAEYFLNTNISIKPELLIEQKGVHGEIQFTDMNGWSLGVSDWYETWNYLTLPLQIQYNPFERNGIYFTAGGYIGYLLWASDRINSENAGGTNQKEKIDISGYNKWDAGLSAGAGIGIPFNEKSGIDVALKYEYAFLTDKGRMPPATHTFSLSVGYIIKFAK